VFEDFQFFSDSAEYPKRTNIKEVQCQTCHAIYLNPCYTTEGFGYLFAEAGQSYGHSEGRPQEQIDYLANRIGFDDGKIFLDIGCYDGQFLSYLPNNIRRIGIDIDEPAIERGRDRHGENGIEFIHSSFENVQIQIKPDVISMFHVLEHLENPYEVIRHLRSISHDETRFIIEVPVLEYGNTNDINGFFSIQHMTHFSIHSLSALVSRAGWSIIEKQKMPNYNGYRVIAKPAEPILEIFGNVLDRTEAHSCLGHWQNSLVDVSRKMETWPETSRMVIWGGGIHSEFLYQVTSLFQQNLNREYLVVDSDPLKQGKSWRGLHIMHPEILKEIDWDDCLLVVSSYGGQESIAQAAMGMHVPDIMIKRLYDQTNVY
jgi:SAM-dependent methyltransferase